jgi:hypothetical protein
VEVRDREPTLGATEVIFDLKLDSDNAPRPEQDLLVKHAVKNHRLLRAELRPPVLEALDRLPHPLMAKGASSQDVAGILWDTIATLERHYA